MVVQPGLCGTWSETPKTGFLTTRLILLASLMLFNSFRLVLLSVSVLFSPSMCLNVVLYVAALMKVSVLFTPSICLDDMNRIARKPTFGCSNQIRPKTGLMTRDLNLQK